MQGKITLTKLTRSTRDPLVLKMVGRYLFYPSTLEDLRCLAYLPIAVTFVWPRKEA